MYLYPVVMTTIYLVVARFLIPWPDVRPNLPEYQQLFWYQKPIYWLFLVTVNGFVLFTVTWVFMSPGQITSLTLVVAALLALGLEKRVGWVDLLASTTMLMIGGTIRLSYSRSVAVVVALTMWIMMVVYLITLQNIYFVWLGAGVRQLENYLLM